MTEKPQLFWAGFVEGKLDITETSIGFGGWDQGPTHLAPVLFKTRREALQQYEDVRRVEVRIVKP